MRLSGASGKENVGMSNDKGRGNAPIENPRFPEQRLTYQGQPGTKGYPRGEPDDEAVNIPPLALQESV